MKKLASMLLVLCLMVGLCGCVGSDAKETKMTVVDNNGESVQISASEILEIHQSNGVQFNSKYYLAHAYVTGKVQSINYSFTSVYSREVEVYTITLEEGWQVEVLKADHAEVENLNVGDTITIQSVIQTAAGVYVTMRDIGVTGTGSNAKYKDHTIIN